MSAEAYLHVPDGEYFEAIDLDNTLINTRMLQRKLEADVEMHAIDSDALRLARMSSRGFDTVAYIRKELERLKVANPEDVLEEIRMDFFEAVEMQGEEEFFLPGALEILDVLKTQRRHHALVTTGGGSWQAKWKAEAVGLGGVPIHVTSGREKSRMLNSYYDAASGRYYFPDVDGLPQGYTGFSFQRYRLPDDNPDAHLDIRPENTGFVIAHSREAYEALQGREFPPNVIRSLGLAAYKEALMMDS